MCCSCRKGTSLVHMPCLLDVYGGLHWGYHISGQALFSGLRDELLAWMDEQLDRH